MKNEQTILVVDDNEVNLDILVSLLWEYDVVPLVNGNSVFEIVESEEVDLILLDVMMPDINGFDICKHLKSDEKTKHIPVIFITAKHGSDDIKNGFDVGAVDYVAKPFNATELLSRVNTHIQLKSYQEDLERKVKIEIEKNKIQEQMIFQNSKQAEIGELLMHIAHQWKQPLSELGSVNLLNTLNIASEPINKNELEVNFNRISTILDFMSKTIETFQDFYQPSRNNIIFDIYSTVEKAVSIISATLDYENITMNIHKKSNPQVYANQNEYAQVILSILNNAKDILIYRKIEDKEVILTIDSLDDKSVVTIEDTAGGILLDNLEDIFVPYVSERGSTGLGLSMAKNIIEKNGGLLDVENTQKGAKLTIVL